MGVPVTLDSDTVEALILGCQLATQFEQALQVLENDPATSRTKPRLKAAVEEAQRRRNDAIRPADFGDWSPPTRGELERLARYVHPQKVERMELILDLRIKGLLTTGHANLVWGDGSRADPFPHQYAKATEKGLQAMRAAGMLIDIPLTPLREIEGYRD